MLEVPLLPAWKADATSVHHIFDRIVEARGRRIREELRETFRGCRRRCRRRQMYCQPPYSPPLRHRWSGALLAFQGKFFAEPSETSEAPFWRLLPLHSVASTPPDLFSAAISRIFLNQLQNQLWFEVWRFFWFFKYSAVSLSLEFFAEPSETKYIVRLHFGGWFHYTVLPLVSWCDCHIFV